MSNGDGGEGGNNWLSGLFTSPTHLSRSLGTNGLLTVSILLSAVLLGLVTLSVRQ